MFDLTWGMYFVWFVAVPFLSEGFFILGLAAVFAAWSGKTRPFRSSFYSMLVFIGGAVFWLIVGKSSVEFCLSFGEPCTSSIQNIISDLFIYFIFLGPLIFFGLHLRHMTKNNSPTMIVKKWLRPILILLGLIGILASSLFWLEIFFF